VAFWGAGNVKGRKRRHFRAGGPSGLKQKEITNDAGEHAFITLPRVFVIGFNKCGTRTIHHYFESNGYRSAHWDKGELAATVFRNLIDSRPLITGYEAYSVFSDMECISGRFAMEAYKLYPYLSTAYPDSLFILNTRDVDKWIESRLGHGDGGYANKWKRIFKVKSNAELIRCWREDWERHHHNVERYFAGSPFRFLKFNIETDLPEKINAVLPEYRLDVAKFERRGGRASAKGGEPRSAA
jgi:hypothetical protein